MVGNSCENVASKMKKKMFFCFFVDPECYEKAKTENQKLNFLDIQPNQIEQPNQCTSCTSGSAEVGVHVCECAFVCVCLYMCMCGCVC